MDMFGEAFDTLGEVETRFKDMTVDQQLKVAEIRALLSISQELSRIHHEGINPEYDSRS